MLFKKYKTQIRKLILDLVHQQWSTLGALGSQQQPKDSPYPLDLEALLLITSFLGRYEPRLYDDLFSWLSSYGQWINVQRLKTLQKKSQIADASILSAIAAFMQQQHKDPKWNRLATQFFKKNVPSQALFLNSSGEPMTHFGTSDALWKSYGWLRGPTTLKNINGQFNLLETSSLTLKLRMLWGINIRSELISYLLCHPQGRHASGIARELGFTPKGVQDTLHEMEGSGQLRYVQEGRQKIYSLYPLNAWKNFLLPPDIQQNPQYKNWTEIFCAIRLLWKHLHQANIENQAISLQASNLRQLKHSMMPHIEKSKQEQHFSSDHLYLNETYLSVFFDNVLSMLKS